MDQNPYQSPQDAADAQTSPSKRATLPCAFCQPEMEPPSAGITDARTQFSEVAVEVSGRSNLRRGDMLLRG